MTEWLHQILDTMGYGGIFLALVLARMAPPVPAETVIPLAGMGVMRGEFDLVGVAVAAGLGSAVGELFWYLPSRLIGPERLSAFLGRHGHWLTVKPEEVRRATRWFQRHGGVAVFLCQPLPGLRTLISVPAGACRLPVLTFLLFAAAGSGLWSFVLASGGFLLQARLPGIADYAGLFVLGLLVTLVGLYLLRLVRQARRGPTGP
ncbi:DedA family protein [Arenibaculum pallidiluteum]|uniref:DedA family protein n=1 Tax=Arenibaculum pallidiluteum TaxID=2812559 RepID=UPI001A97AEE3|nr:VTT domain-containing protein [Arenibaculum pallidiluteum]